MIWVCLCFDGFYCFIFCIIILMIIVDIFGWKLVKTTTRKTNREKRKEKATNIHISLNRCLRFIRKKMVSKCEKKIRKETGRHPNTYTHTHIRTWNTIIIIPIISNLSLAQQRRTKETYKKTSRKEETEKRKKSLWISFRLPLFIYFISLVCYTLINFTYAQMKSEKDKYTQIIIGFILIELININV